MTWPGLSLARKYNHEVRLRQTNLGAREAHPLEHVATP